MSLKRSFYFRGVLAVVTWDKYGVLDTIVLCGKPIDAANPIAKLVIRNSTCLREGRIPDSMAKAGWRGES